MQENVKPSNKTGEAKRRARFIRVFFGRKAVVVCLAILIAILIAAIIAPYICLYKPNKQDLSSALLSFSAKHLLGTDSMGRDVLTRIIYGARISYSVGFVAVLFSGIIGMFLGAVAGIVGGVADSVIMRIMDAMLSIPMIIMALFLGSIFGKGLFNVIMAVGISMIPSYARVTRGQVLTLNGLDYVTAGTICGAGKLQNAISHIIPNCLSPVIILMTMNLGTAILNEAALSYLGMGINPPTASWGGMVSDGYSYLSMNPIIAIAPGVAILIVVLCFNIVGDALRDALDPKLRGALK
jgi:peptide/nickel transport system permease protein